MRDLILGIINGYAYYEIRRFMVSLRQTNSSAHLCLFAGPAIGSGTRQKLRRLGAEVVDYAEDFPFIREPHPDAPASLPSPIYIFNYRHFLYYDYLLKHGGAYRNVLLTDVKDVVFQADPFGFQVADAVHVAMENTNIPLGACCCTPDWILAGYDQTVLDRVKTKELSCAGTTIAPTARMKTYLRQMLEQIQSMKDAYVCADQAAHNLLLHDGALEPVKRLYNFEGPVLTVGTEPQYRINDDGKLVNRDGSVIAIVHQYDRHPDLIELFDARAFPSRWRRRFAKVSFRVTSGLKRRLRRLLSPLYQRIKRSRAFALGR
jgi:hypothetical protein